MKKKIYYWSPCLNPVGTVISTLNSAVAFSKYNKDYDVTIINACGEWDNYKDIINKNSINLIDLNFKYFKYLPKTGFLKSRFSYIIIFILSFLPLLLLLKKTKPNYIIIHLITSLPLTLLNFFNFKTKFILRLSGYPKLHLFRKYFWKKISKKLSVTTCPTHGLMLSLIKTNIFNNKKIVYLPDAILNLDNININKEFIIEKNFNKKKIIMSVGRLTKQKNFSYLIAEFEKFCQITDDYVLYIIGEGEERKNLELQIKKNNLLNKVFLLGRKNNVYNYMKSSDVFVLSSLWEEVGFVIVEAAFNNLYVISSDCPNGPSEFLNNGQNGLLFSSDTDNALKLSLIKYSKLDKNKNFKDRVSLKKNSINYTKFRHYLKLKNILSSLSN